MAEPAANVARGQLRDFLLACLLWLPTAFLAWYWLAPAIQVGAWVVADLARGLLLPQLVSAIEVDGRLFEVVTRIPASSATPNAVLAFAVDPLIYSCGMPLFAGLCLASPGSFAVTLGRLAAGILALVPVQAFGVLMTILKMLAFDLVTDAGRAWAIGAGSREAIALAYQLSSLVLPGVAALVLWALLNRDFVLQMTRRGPGPDS
jgi:hypothetical protein